MKTITGAAEQGSPIFREWRRHWRVGLTAIIGMGLGGGILPSIFSLFIIPLQNDFGWSRGDIALANNTLIVAAFAAPFAGSLIDRKGVRVPLLVSTALLALGFFMLSAMSGSLYLYYGLYGFLVLGSLLTTGLAYSRVICSAFVQTRGFSLAAGRSGMSLSSALLPILLFTIIVQFGWRAGYATMGILVLLIAFPLVWFWIKSDSSVEAVATAPQSVPILQLLTDRVSLTITFAAALAYMPLLAVLTQAQPILIEKGLSPELAAVMVGMTGIASLAGAFFTGVLLDRFWAPGVAAIMLVGGALGASILAFAAPGPEVAIGGIALIGLTMGAELDVVAYVIARYCGMKRYSSVYGLSVMGLTIAVAVGSSGIGLLYDRFGDYTLALAIGSGSFLLSAAAYLSLGRAPKELAEHGTG